MSAKDAARQYVRTDVFPQWLNHMNVEYLKNFWMWVRAFEV